MGPIPIDRIVACLRQLGIRDDDSILVHSNLFNLCYGWPGAAVANQSASGYARQLIRALRDICGSAGALIMPTEFVPDHQLAALRHEVLDLRVARTNRGSLPNLFLEWADVRRSLHPIYNVAGVGLDGAIARHAEFEYSMDVGSPWWEFTRMGGKVLLLGVGLEADSLIHLPEYVLKAEYPRPVFFNRPHEFRVVDEDGQPHEVRGYLHGVRWPGWTVSKFLCYLNGRYSFYQTIHLHHTPITVIDAQLQYDALMSELDAGIAWYDAVGWA